MNEAGGWQGSAVFTLGAVALGVAGVAWTGRLVYAVVWAYRHER